jgi:hypothetical protein
MDLVGLLRAEYTRRDAMCAGSFCAVTTTTLPSVGRSRIVRHELRASDSADGR